MATAPSANDLTRQQLDELDALLQRMLALPNTSPESNTPSPISSASTWRTDLPTPTLALRQTPPEPLVPRLRDSNELPFGTPIPGPEPTIPVTDRRSATVAPPNPFATAFRTDPAPMANTAPFSGGEPVPFFLYPLVAFNWAVDTVLGFCGPPGWLLRSGVGKNCLGLAGVGLLAYTAAHVASQQGWITLPFTLPWPR